MNPINIGFWYPIRAVTDPITQLKIDLIQGNHENKNLTQELSKARAENLLLRERLQKYEPI